MDGGAVSRIAAYEGFGQGRRTRRVAVISGSDLVTESAANNWACDIVAHAAPMRAHPAGAFECFLSLVFPRLLFRFSSIDCYSPR